MTTFMVSKNEHIETCFPNLTFTFSRQPRLVSHKQDQTTLTNGGKTWFCLNTLLCPSNCGPMTVVDSHKSLYSCHGLALRNPLACLHCEALLWSDGAGKLPIFLSFQPCILNLLSTVRRITPGLVVYCTPFCNFLNIRHRTYFPGRRLQVCRGLTLSHQVATKYVGHRMARGPTGQDHYLRLYEQFTLVDIRAHDLV